MKPPAHLLVWDLDNTLGVFDALESHEDHNRPVTVMLRPGIVNAVRRLSAEGFTQAVLTMASARYAELVLRATGLRRFFDDVSGGDQRPKGDDDGLAELFGIPQDEKPARMMFIGDHPWFDAPRDPRIVFHFEPNALRRPAAPLVSLALLLRSLGGGSFRAGFDKLVEDSLDAGRYRHVVRPGVGSLILLPRADEAPVVVFEDGVGPTESSASFTFVPAEIDLALR